jgi:ATP-dependent RNA helicase DeaD
MALLSKLTIEKKTYDHIEAPAKKRNEQFAKNQLSGSRSDSRSSSGTSSSRNSSRDLNYKKASINLGKNDGIRPPQLLDYFKKYADMFPKNIGDIVIYPNETEFQIHPAAIKRLNDLNNKLYNGKKIKITMLKN